MCEIFGVTGKKEIYVNDYLRTIAKHSLEHPDGWGIATFYKDFVNIEKEPITACKSHYLKQLLHRDIYAKNLFMHIRLATKGTLDYLNCHPFVKRDKSNRAWTLMHNGTIFENKQLEKYVYVQKGTTDSERILLYIIDQINRKIEEVKRELTTNERFHIIDQVMCEITQPNNKVNVLLFDGEMLYVHTNYPNTLHYKKVDSSIIFSTVPLDRDKWEPVRNTTLLAYYEDCLKYIGTNHKHEYQYKTEDMKYLYLDFTEL